MSLFQDLSIQRKLTWIIMLTTCIALLLFPLFYLGQPATHQSSGGLLAQMRADEAGIIGAA